MKTGDLVTAIPLSDTGEEYPSMVTGRLEVVPVKFLGERWNTYLVYVKDSDGDDTPVEVQEDSIRGAGRRDKVTVL